MINRTMTPAEWALLLALSLLWGGSFFFIGVAVKELPPLTIVLMRVVIAAAVLNLVLRLAGQTWPAELRVWGAFLVLGLSNNLVPFGLIVWGQTQIPSGLAAILNATTPLFGVAVAHVMTADEKMTGLRLAGVVVGFGGVVLMLGPELLGGLGGDLPAQIAILGASCSYAVGGVYARRFRAWGVSPLATATGQVTAAAVMLAPVALLLDRPWTLAMPGAGTLGAVISLAVLSTALAYVVYFRILATAGATNVLLVTFLVPVSALILGHLFLGESVEPRQLLGMATIGLGLAAIDGRLVRRLFA